MIRYRVGVKRRFWFGYKVYYVENFFLRGFAKLHDTQGMDFEGPVSPMLVLKLPNNRDLFIGNIENRDWWTEEIKPHGVPALPV